MGGEGEPVVFRSRREREKAQRGGRPRQEDTTAAPRGPRRGLEAFSADVGTPRTHFSAPGRGGESIARGVGVGEEGSEDDEGFLAYEREQLLRVSSGAGAGAAGVHDFRTSSGSSLSFQGHYAALRTALREAAAFCILLVPLETELLRLRAAQVGGSRVSLRPSGQLGSVLDVEFAKERAGIGGRASAALAEAGGRGMKVTVRGVLEMVDECRATFPRHMHDDESLTSRLDAVARELVLPLLRKDLLCMWEPLLALGAPLRPDSEEFQALHAQGSHVSLVPWNLPAFIQARIDSGSAVAECASACFEGILRAVEVHAWLPHFGAEGAERLRAVFDPPTA